MKDKKWFITGAVGLSESISKKGIIDWLSDEYEDAEEVVETADIKVINVLKITYSNGITDYLTVDHDNKIVHINPYKKCSE